jgi:dihydroxy-acid dehydratase
MWGAGNHEIFEGVPTMSSKTKNGRRSTAWFGSTGGNGFLYRSWMRNQGLPDHVFDGRPVIGICNTFSELTPCNAHLRDLADYVKRGIWEAGGLPLEFPVMSLGETLVRPTAMLYRNLVSMDVEETIRANPVDGVVLLAGCDKTTPAVVMGAASCDLPTIVVSGGPMLNGKFQGQDIGSGTDLIRFTAELRAGNMTQEAYKAAEVAMSRSAGHCMVMGTASTMANLVEAMGLSLPGNGSWPAVDSRRRVLAHMSGRRIVEMVEENLCISQIVRRPSMLNAIVANAALGGSTNAVVHLLAMAGRIGVDLTLDDWDRSGRNVPTLVDLKPAGRFLMEDYCYAGGLAPVLDALGDHIDRTALTVSGRTIGEQIAGAPNYNTEVIRAISNPVVADGGIAVLKGNLAPRGAVLKTAAASPSLMQHTGRAVVFDSFDDYRKRCDLPDLEIDETCVIVVKNCGPKGYPGMPEVGNVPLPKKILMKGIRDMVRISDARMSGTAYGTVVLHTSPESADRGPLAIVRDGDVIELDVAQRRIHLRLSPEEIEARLNAWVPPNFDEISGYERLYRLHVLPADMGADLDFLRGCRGAAVPKPGH